MATMRPELSEGELTALPRKARGEAKFYRACRNLPSRVLVYYSVQTLNENMVEGEADFVLFDSERGMLVVEVKGGGVTFDPATGRWRSTDQHGVDHVIRDPFVQARDRCHELARYVLEHKTFKAAVNGRISTGYGVFFVDLTARQVAQIERPDIQPSVVGCVDDLATLEEWLSAAFDAWQRPGQMKLGKPGRAAVEQILRGPVSARPLLSTRLREEEERRIQLTFQQAQTLELLEGRSRVAISGGAGTGKTVLAVMRAQRVAETEGRALLLCYNRALSDHLKDSVNVSDRFHPQQIHQFCGWWVDQVSAKFGRNLRREADEALPGQDWTHYQLPYAFILAVEDYDVPVYTDVIVDEAQDFTDDDWAAVMSFVEKLGARLCLFFDHNQILYRRSNGFPIKDERDQYLLTRNCRNTVPIHEACYKYYSGPATRFSPIAGEPIKKVVGETVDQQAALLAAEIRGLLAEEVRPRDIVVLVLGASGGIRDFFPSLRREALPSGVTWVEKTHGGDSAILVDTVARFKGLESTVVFLWVGADVDAEVHRGLIYVGTSRAKGRLFLVGTAAACKVVEDGAIGS